MEGKGNQMNINELICIHEDTCEKARGIMKQKNHDYTDGSVDPFANFRMSTLVGIDPRIGLLLRVMDKIKRMQTFTNKGTLAVADEGFNDAIEDVINYMILLKGLNA